MQVAIDKHPALGVAYALSLFAGTGGDSDPELANRILGDVLKDENAQDKLKGLSAAALGDSARLGRARRLTSSSQRRDTRQHSALVIAKLPKRSLSIGRIAWGVRRQETCFLTAQLRRIGTSVAAKIGKSCCRVSVSETR